MAGRAGRAYAYVVALLLASAALMLTPQLGLASSGGASPGSTPSGGSSHGSGTTSGSTGTVQSGNVTVTAAGGGMTIATRASTMLSRRLRFTGRASSSAAGRTVEIERLGNQTQWRWAPTAHARIRRDGSFSATWVTNHIGRFAIRAVIAGRGPRTAASSPSVTVTVYRMAIATIFGPGFYGAKTACGITLTRQTLGTANRTLPCGTQVAMDYNGRTIVVPVIDRGPYANHADWDLTEATARALGMNGTATIGAVSLPRR